MNSHNHPMMGSIDSWFYKYLLGIVPDAEHPGFDRFTIHPYVVDDLEFAEGEFNSVKGTIRSGWSKKNGVLSLNVTIPANSVATVYVPSSRVGSITESGKKRGESAIGTVPRRTGRLRRLRSGIGGLSFPVNAEKIGRAGDRAGKRRTAGPKDSGFPYTLKVKRGSGLFTHRATGKADCTCYRTFKAFRSLYRGPRKPSSNRRSGRRRPARPPIRAVPASGDGLPKA